MSFVPKYIYASIKFLSNCLWSMWYTLLLICNHLLTSNSTFDVWNLWKVTSGQYDAQSKHQYILLRWLKQACGHLRLLWRTSRIQSSSPVPLFSFGWPMNGTFPLQLFVWLRTDADLQRESMTHHSSSLANTGALATGTQCWQRVLLKLQKWQTQRAWVVYHLASKMSYEGLLHPPPILCHYK